MSNQKDGLDYFPLDVDIEQDDKIALIQAKHGIVGYAVILKMFTKIYADKGYYYNWNERTQLLFSGKVGVEYNKVIEIISDAIEWEIFDKIKFKKYQILTSKRIQETYLEATKRRKTVELFNHYLLVNGQNVNLKRENVNILKENANILTQSKVKESKVKESKVNYADTVTMFETEYKKLLEEYGEEVTKKMITILDNYKDSKGKTYKSDYKAILSWVVDKVLGDNKKKENWRTT